MKDELVLEVKDLGVHFYTEDGVVPAVDGVSLKVRKGQTLGLVGESGCGKTVTALSILRLVPRPGQIVSGQILLDGDDLITLDEEEMAAVRGCKVSMIFQEPMTSLNPVFTVGDQVREAILVHQKIEGTAARERAIEMLRVVGIPLPEQRFRSYPHELSGGMRQRVMIAMALSCNPSLLIADEPTTALDVTIQAQILELMRQLKEQTNMGILLITHDLGVIAEMADEVAVMYTGKIVEQADATSLFKNPKHPYTQGLLASMPALAEGRERLHVISGTVPNLLRLPPGCRFAPRCPHVMEICRDNLPPLKALNDSHTTVRCWLY